MSDSPKHSQDEAKKADSDQSVEETAKQQPAYTPQARTDNEDDTPDDLPEKAPGFTPQGRADT